MRQAQACLKKSLYVSLQWKEYTEKICKKNVAIRGQNSKTWGKNTIEWNQAMKQEILVAD